MRGLFRVWIITLSVLTVATASASSANPAKVRYDTRNVGDFNQPAELPMPPQGSGAYGVNNAGDVTGWSYYFADSSVYAMLYVNSTGELIKLRALPPDGFISYGYAVNDSGVVVGGATRAGRFGFHPFSWQAGVMTDLFADVPGCLDGQLSCEGFAYDINSRGDIVGNRSIGGTPVNGAFLYSHRTFTDLGEPGSTATAISNRGNIAGTSSGRAFIFRGGMMRDLGTLGGAGSSANDISENNKVVGVADTAQGERHAFLWTNGEMRDLGTLGGSFSEATAVNRRGTTVVGNSTTPTGEVHGFVYARGHMVDLNELIDPGTGPIIDVQDINDHGQIAGRMAFATSNPLAPIKWNGMLLTPRR